MELGVQWSGYVSAFVLVAPRGTCKVTTTLSVAPCQRGSRQAGGPPRCRMESTRLRVVCRHTLSTTSRAAIAASRPASAPGLQSVLRYSVSRALNVLACGRTVLASADEILLNLARVEACSNGLSSGVGLLVTVIPGPSLGTPSASLCDAPNTAARAVPPGSSSSPTAKCQRPVTWDEGMGKWVKEKRASPPLKPASRRCVRKECA